jgi:hypothetical protein
MSKLIAAGLAAALAMGGGGSVATGATSGGHPAEHRYAARLLHNDAAQVGCLDQLWDHESGWDPTVYNMEGSGAYGIPQALPASKMASAGADWQTNPRTQIRWGLGYIAQVYGSPCQAWSFWQANGWY